jgi:hypothetical protein
VTGAILADARSDGRRPQVGEVPVLDLEEGSGDQSGRANQWFGIIDDAYGLTSLPLSQRSWLSAARISRHLVPAAGRPGQLGDDRLQPGRLITALTGATGDQGPHTRRDEATPRRVPALSAHQSLRPAIRPTAC